MAERAQYDIQSLAQFNRMGTQRMGTQLITNLSGKTFTLPVSTDIGDIESADFSCACVRGGIRWWGLVDQISTDLVVCKTCNNQWRREIWSGGHAEWRFYGRFVIQELP
jgi:hypothetical protein